MEGGTRVGVTCRDDARVQVPCGGGIEEFENVVMPTRRDRLGNPIDVGDAAHGVEHVGEDDDDQPRADGFDMIKIGIDLGAVGVPHDSVIVSGVVLSPPVAVEAGIEERLMRRT